MRALLNRIWTTLFGFDIFVSYRRGDAEAYAGALVRRLEQRGLICFLDRDETVGGVELTPAIEKALRRSRMLVAVLTPGVLTSEWVQREIQAFAEKDNRLLPVSAGGFLSGEAVTGTPLEPLRQLSWIDESSQAVADGEPGDATLDEIVKSHRWRKVRTLARWLLLGLALALVVGGWSTGRFIIEQRRQTQVAYKDISQALGEVDTLVAFLSGAATNFRTSSFEFRRAGSRITPRILEGLEALDLARARLPGPLIGYEPVSSPGDTRRVVEILSVEAQRLSQELERLRRLELALMEAEVPRLLEQLVGHAFLEALTDAEAKLERYHRIEDSSIQPFYLLGNPGVSSSDDFLSFVELLERTRVRVRSLARA